LNASPHLGPGEYFGSGKEPWIRLAPRGTNLFAGSVAAGAIEQAIGSQPCKTVFVQNDPASANNVIVGPSGRQVFVLRPADSIQLDVIDVSLVYCRAPAGAPVVNWLALV
jgi:hypothetical protein